jgi:hypothetical protein
VWSVHSRKGRSSTTLAGREESEDEELEAKRWCFDVEGAGVWSAGEDVDEEGEEEEEEGPSESSRQPRVR